MFFGDNYISFHVRLTQLPQISTETPELHVIIQYLDTPKRKNNQC